VSGRAIPLGKELARKKVSSLCLCKQGLDGQSDFRKGFRIGREGSLEASFLGHSGFVCLIQVAPPSRHPWASERGHYTLGFAIP
jgi:hypothetical protein